MVRTIQHRIAAVTDCCALLQGLVGARSGTPLAATHVPCLPKIPALPIHRHPATLPFTGCGAHNFVTDALTLVAMSVTHSAVHVWVCRWQCWQHATVACPHPLPPAAPAHHTGLPTAAVCGTQPGRHTCVPTGATSHGVPTDTPQPFEQLAVPWPSEILSGRSQQ